MGQRGLLTTLSGVAALISVSLIVYNYWHSPKQLLRYVYSFFLLFAFFAVIRHIWFSIAGPLIASFDKKEEVNGKPPKCVDSDHDRTVLVLSHTLLYI